MYKYSKFYIKRGLLLIINLSISLYLHQILYNSSNHVWIMSRQSSQTHNLGSIQRFHKIGNAPSPNSSHQDDGHSTHQIVSKPTPTVSASSVQLLGNVLSPLDEYSLYGMVSSILVVVTIIIIISIISSTIIFG